MLECGDTAILEISVPPKTAEPSNEVLSSQFEWSFSEMQPMFAFCNWQFKVKGYEAHMSGEADAPLAGHTVTIQVSSPSGSEETEGNSFEMVSAVDLQFDFKWDSVKE